MVRHFVVILVFLSLLSAFSASADATTGAEADLFPRPAGLEPNVRFWTRVFAEWTLGQVAIHDLEYPELVYEIVDLPGPIGESYTEQQKDWIEALNKDWEYYLYTLEQKVRDDKPLEEVDKAWAVHIATLVGADKLAGAHRRVRSQRGLRERFLAGLERSFRLDRRIREIMREHGLPEDLAYLPHVESSFQYRARSSAGATGLWQFTRGTGRQYLNINSAIDERLDPVAATRGAAEYLKDAYEKLDTWPLALTSYNHGVGGMLRAKKRFGTDFERIFREYDGRSFGFASRNFYAEFLAARDIANNPGPFFPEGYSPEPEMDLDSVVLERRVTPYWLSTEYDVPLDELAALNMAWSSRAVDNGLRLPTGTEVWLPRGTLERVAGRRRGAAAPATQRHVVSSGETLGRIASSYGVRLSALLSANTLTTRSIIHPGQVLQIPD